MVAEPVTLPVKFPVNDVAVMIPAPASTPLALIVTAAPTMAETATSCSYTCDDSTIR